MLAAPEATCTLKHFIYAHCSCSCVCLFVLAAQAEIDCLQVQINKFPIIPQLKGSNMLMQCSQHSNINWHFKMLSKWYLTQVCLTSICKYFDHHLTRNQYICTWIVPSTSQMKLTIKMRLHLECTLWWKENNRL